MQETLVFIIMLGVFLACSFWLRLPVGLAMVLSAVGGALAAGEGLAFRHLLEGSMGFLDTMLVVAMAMLFMKMVEATGALQELSRRMVLAFAGRPILLLTATTLFIMFPGMVTGSSTASALTTGAVVAPMLLSLGIPRIGVGTIIAVSSLLGMAAPPVSIPLMIIGGGVDMPYVGFALPLLVLTVPIAVITTLALGYRYAKGAAWDEVRAQAGAVTPNDGTWRLYLPFGVVIVALIGQHWFPQLVPSLGIPLILFLGSLMGLASNRSVSFIKVASDAVQMALPILGILVGVGVFIQIMTLSGVRGLLVTTALAMPDVWLYVGIALALPLFGAVSSFGSASVMGVPFLLALLGTNDVVIAAALSVLAALGDMMPPTALCGIFAARVVEMDDYMPLLRRSVLPMAAVAGVSMLTILFAQHLGFLVI